MRKEDFGLLVKFSHNNTALESFHPTHFSNKLEHPETGAREDLFHIKQAYNWTRDHSKFLRKNE